MRSLMALVILLASASAVLADHGKGAVGGRTISGRTLHEGDFSLGVGLKYQNMDRISWTDLDQFATDGHDVDSQDWLLEFSMGAAYGVTDRLTLSASLPFLVSRGFRESEFDPSGPSISQEEATNIVGLGDATLLAKYGIVSGAFDIAFLAGFKMGTGSTREETNGGDRLSPDHQPGTGSWDPIFGVAATYVADERLTFDANVLYQITTKGRQDFEAGDLLHLNVRAEYQLTALGKWPRVFGDLELNFQWAAKDQVLGDKDPDSGGVIFYVSPGIKARLDAHLTISLSVPVPVYQGLTGEQHEEEFEVLFGIGYDL